MLLHLMQKQAMRTTLTLDNLLKEAIKLIEIPEKSALLQEGLQALIARESARRLALLDGSEKQLNIAHASV